MQQGQSSASLRIQVLGTTRITYAGEPVTDSQGRQLPAKVVKLLVYLAVTGRPATRGEIRELIWQGNDPANVRGALTLLRGSTAAGDWLNDGEAVSLVSTTDLAGFRAALESRNFAQALEIWGHHDAPPDAYVMPGTAGSDPGSAPFDEWLESVRQEALEEYMTALYGAAVETEAKADFARVLEYAQALLAADAFHEDANHWVMFAQVQLGEHRSALSHFDRLRRLLVQEGLPGPADNLVSLREQAEGALKARAERRRTHLESLESRLHSPGIPFTGRVDEIARLAELLRKPGGAVTVHGAGGVGKSRLAAELGRALADTFEDGVALVAMTNVREVEDGARAILGGLGVAATAGESASEQLVRYVKDLDLLLILDDAQPGNATASIVELVMKARGVRCLLTSRTPVGFAGEQLFPLYGLSHQSSESHAADVDTLEAAQLFVQAARRHDPDFALQGTADAQALAGICGFVTGIPLYLEHIAAWTRVMSLQDIARDLTSGSELLDELRSELPEHHQQLRLVLDHSWQLLPEASRLPTARLAVFKGGFTLAAAKQVGQVGLRDLREAVDAAFIRRTSDDWFELHDVPRDYMHGLLQDQDGQLGELSLRHLEYFTGIAEEMGQELAAGKHADWLSVFNRNRANLELAYRQAQQGAQPQLVKFVSHLGTPLVDFGHHAEALDLFQRVIADSPPASPHLVKIMVNSAAILRQRNELDETASLLDRAIALAEQLDDDGARLVGIAARAALLLQQRQTEPAMELLHSSLHLARRLKKGALAEVRIMSNLAVAHTHMGDYGTAISWYTQALALARESQDVESTGLVAGNLAIVHHIRAEFDQAHDLYQESIRAKRASGDRFGLMLSLGNLGALLRSQDKPDAAEEAWQEQHNLAEAAGSKPELAASLANLGRAAYIRLDFAAARVKFEQALALFRQTGAQTGVVNNLLNLVLAHTDLTRRRTYINEALELGRKLAEQQRFSIAGTLHVAAQVAEDEGDHAQALELLRESSQLASVQENPQLQALLATRLGCLASTMGANAVALELLGAADRAYFELGIVREPPDQQRVDRTRERALISSSTDPEYGRDVPHARPDLMQEIERQLGGLEDQLPLDREEHSDAIELIT